MYTQRLNELTLIGVQLQVCEPSLPNSEISAQKPNTIFHPTKRVFLELRNYHRGREFYAEARRWRQRGLR